MVPKVTGGVLILAGANLEHVKKERKKGAQSPRRGAIAKHGGGRRGV